MNILRRVSLARLLLGCALAIVLGASATALAFAIGAGPTPPPKPLAEAVHEALTATPVQGFSANVQLTDHLLEGASLATGQGSSSDSLTSSPLLSGGSGRIWVANDGRVRLELQSEEGDTEVIYDGRKLSIYDAATNTLYRYTPPAGERTGRSSEQPSSGEQHAPSVAKIEEAIGKLEHVSVSGATPGDVAGQPAYTVRVSPKEGGSLLGGAELSWDAENGVPLRAAIYSSKSSAAVIELASSEVSFGPVSSSVFEITPPASAKVEELKPATEPQAGAHGSDHQSATTHGSGVSAVEVIETKTKPGQKPTQLPEQLPKVKIGASTAAELSTALGTVLGFERAGASFLVFGALEPAQIEAVARGL